MNEYMKDYYTTMDKIREEQATWFPVPDYIITRLIDIEVQRLFGKKIKWQYDNAPETIGDFGCEEPDGRYDYERYKKVITLKIPHSVPLDFVYGYDAVRKRLYISGDWLWKNHDNQPSTEFGHGLSDDDQKRIDKMKEMMEKHPSAFLNLTKKLIIE